MREGGWNGLMKVVYTDIQTDNWTQEHTNRQTDKPTKDIHTVKLKEDNTTFPVT